jgi:hypothetical protein
MITTLDLMATFLDMFSLLPPYDTTVLRDCKNLRSESEMENNVNDSTVAPEENIGRILWDGADFPSNVIVFFAYNNFIIRILLAVLVTEIGRAGSNGYILASCLAYSAVLSLAIASM